MVRSPTINVPPNISVRLTPTSEEACLRHGVNPEALRERRFESFSDYDGDEEIQHMRHEAYAQRRTDLMSIVSAEKRDILARNFGDPQKHADESQLSPATTSSSVSGGSKAMPKQSLTPGKIVETQISEGNSLIRQEQRRLEKVKLRQEKEVRQVLDVEQKTEALQKKKREREEREAKEQEARRKQREKSAKEFAEEKRQKELGRKAVEDADEMVRRRIELANFERQKVLLAERERERQLQQKKAQVVEQERREKLDDQKREKEERAKVEKMRVEQKLEIRQKKEREKQKKLELKRQQDREAVAERRKTAAERIAQNQEAAAKFEAQRKVSVARCKYIVSVPTKNQPLTSKITEWCTPLGRDREQHAKT
jgi:hypothetical protein